MHLSGSSVLITGGASGIGAALARRVTAKGARVGLIDRDAPGLGAYAASKAGVEALGRVLRAELAPHGVGVGVAYYLFLATPMVAGGEQMASFRELKGGLPGPIGRTYPLEPAIEATVAGIERRARVVAYPKFIRPVMR